MPWVEAQLHLFLVPQQKETIESLLFRRLINLAYLAEAICDTALEEENPVRKISKQVSMKSIKVDFVARIERMEKLLEEDFKIFCSIAWQEETESQGAVKQKLIEQLQYHDIIRQKLQHVCLFAPELEAALLQAQSKKEEAVVLANLLELSMALLQYARLEYSGVREKIEKQLCFLKHTVPVASQHYDLFQQEMQEIIRCLDSLYPPIASDDEVLQAGLCHERLKRISESFSMQTEREIFQALFAHKELVQEMANEDDNIELF